MAQHYIKQLIFSWLRMVHRKVIETKSNRERSVFPITFCFTRQTPRMIIERKYCFPLSIMDCFSCSVITVYF